MTKPLSKNSKKGFTLPELVIYAALLALLSLAAVRALLAATDSYLSFKVVREMRRSGVVLVERFSRESRLAESVSATSILDANPGILKLNRSDGSVAEFFLVNDVLYFKDDFGVGALTASTTRVTNLIFRKAGVSSTAVRLELSLEAGQGIRLRTADFYSTSVIRGDYENR